MRIISCIALTAALFSIQADGQRANTPAAKDKNMFAMNECMPKGGIGVISKNLHIDLKSAKNELILGGGERWTGQGAPTPEVVIFFEGRIWPLQTLPDGFDLS